MTAAALPYLLAVGASGLQLNAQREQANERRKILNAQLDRSDQATRRATELVQQEAQNYSPVARAAAMQSQEQAAYDQSAKDLQLGAGGAAIDTAGGQGNVSADFLKAQADKAISEGDRLSSVAREVAKTRAPSLLMQTEGQRRANMAGTLQNLFGTNRNMASAAQQDADSVEEPMYGQLAGLAGQFGSQYAMGQHLKTKYPGAYSGAGAGISFGG